MIDLVNQQLRIRLRDPNLYNKFRTKDFGDKGKMIIIIAYNVQLKKWQTQSIRFNLQDYLNFRAFQHDLSHARVSPKERKRAKELGLKWFRENR